MAAKNEAKIRFTAETKDFNDGIKSANNQLSSLKAEMKLNDAQMKASGVTVEALEEKHKNLENQLTAQEQKTQALSEKLKVAVDVFGENSDEATKLKNQLAASQTAEIKLQTAIKNCNAEIDRQRQAQDKTKTASESLNDAITDQQKELNDLKKKYVDTVLQLGTASDEARELAQQIGDLSEELKDNKDKMSDAESAADELDKSIDDVGEQAENTTNGGFTVFKGMLADLASNIIQSVVSSMKELSSAVVQLGRDFTSSMSEVQAISGATDDELAMLEETARSYGATTVFSASEAADALKYMSLAGWTAQQSADALGGILNLAAASGMDLAKASDMCTDYLSAFGMQASDSAYFADMLAYAQSNSNTTAEALGEAYKNVAANMHAAGQDVETTTSLLAMMANQGLKGSEAGTALAAVLRDMTAKMKDGSIAIGDTNVQVMDANGNYRDMTDILKDVSDATDGMGDAEKATALMSTFTADSVKGLNLMLNAGIDEAAAFEGELRKSSGTAKDMSDVMNNNLDGDLKAMNSALEEAGLSLFNSFESPLRSVAQFITNSVAPVLQSMANWLEEHPVALKIVAATLGVITTALAALTVVTIAQTVAQWALNSAVLANPLTWVIAGIVAAIAAVVAIIVIVIDYWDQIVAAVNTAVEAAKNALSNFVNWIDTNVIQPVVNFFGGLWDGIKNAFSAAWEWIKSTPIFQFYEQLFTSIWNTIKSVIDVVVQLASAAWEIIKAVWSVVSGWFSANITQPIANFFTGMWNGIKNAANTAWNVLKDGATKAWNGIKSVFSPVAQFFGDIFGKAWGKVKDVFSTGGKIFSGITEGITATFKKVVNAIIGGINKVVAIPFNKINSVLSTIRNASFLGISPFKGLGSISVPQIPLLAAGGILTQPTLNIAGEAGPEAVIPIDKLQSYISSAIDRTMQTVNMQALVAAVEDLADRAIELNINGRQFAVATAADADTVNGNRMTLQKRGLAV